jgi:prophage endopeptidase
MERPDWFWGLDMFDLQNMNWKPIALAVGFLFSGYLGYELRSVIAERDAQIAQNNALQQDKTNLSDAVTQSHNIQAKHEQAAEQLTAADTNYLQGVNDGKKDLDKALGDLRNTLRVRNEQLAAERRKRQQSESGHLPDTAACTRECDGAPETGFLVTHGEDALRLAAEADDVTRQLRSCQQTITTYQKLLSNPLTNLSTNTSK